MKTLILQLWQFLHLPKNLQLLVMRMKEDEFLIGVAGVIFNKKNEILLFHHTYRDGNGWNIPAGYLKSKEHPKEGLEREIFEESGLTVCVEERLNIRTDRETARLEIAYTGSFIGGEFTPSSEVSEAKFFLFEDLPRVPKATLIYIQKAIEGKSIPMEPI